MSERETEEFAFIVVEIIVYFFVWLVRFVRVFNANFKLQVALVLTLCQSENMTRVGQVVYFTVEKYRNYFMFSCE